MKSGSLWIAERYREQLNWPGDWTSRERGVPRRGSVSSKFSTPRSIVYRFSQWKSGHYDARIAQSPAELGRILTPLVDAGVDVLHPSTRRHWEPAFAELDGEDGKLGLAGWTKKLTGLPTITVGSVGLDSVFTTAFTGDAASAVTGLERLEAQYDRGEFDMVAIGRALLADRSGVSAPSNGLNSKSFALGSSTDPDVCTRRRVGSALQPRESGPSALLAVPVHECVGGRVAEVAWCLFG